MYLSYKLNKSVATVHAATDTNYFRVRWLSGRIRLHVDFFMKGKLFLCPKVYM